MKSLSVVVVAVVLLGHLSPVAAGMLLCIGEETDPDCCRKTHDSRLGDSTRLLNGSDCGCCIELDAAPATVGAGSHKTSLDIVSGSALIRDDALTTESGIPGAVFGGADDLGLYWLRSVVLLI